MFASNRGEERGETDHARPIAVLAATLPILVAACFLASARVSDGSGINGVARMPPSFKAPARCQLREVRFR